MDSVPLNFQHVLNSPQLPEILLFILNVYLICENLRLQSIYISVRVTFSPSGPNSEGLGMEKKRDHRPDLKQPEKPHLRFFRFHFVSRRKKGFWSMLKISCIRPAEWVLDGIGLRFRPWSYALRDKRNELCGAQLINLCLILTLSKVFRLQRRIRLARTMG